MSQSALGKFGRKQQQRPHVSAGTKKMAHTGCGGTCQGGGKLLDAGRNLKLKGSIADAIGRLGALPEIQ